MDTINPLDQSGVQADAALYFLPQGHYLLHYQHEGKLASKYLMPDDLRAAFSEAERDTGWLTPGIVRTGYSARGSWFVLHTPPQKITINLMEKGCVTIPTPPLVMLGVGRTYYLWAITEDFSPRATIYDAPFPNVHDGGNICWGNNAPPEADPRNAGTAWRLFFESPFNGHLAKNKVRRHANDVRDLLVALDGKQKFPVKQLSSQRRVLASKIESLIK